ncbi:MAG: hypothetical protein A2W91_06435 [Bacteroidetes bacterium GWF2_38_335]|nr:MAG: hypothetical protein A2W91_06435 [Bacteroidetes bacterium GWF2_38_335]OFY77670.1 MAG: hypothetical protein A2281_17950 [Bacteroidetes bacterium RIFOXYA12_FULL_38_20]HBS89101.1 hypothetical protein [Bacteroidales bacterium]
MRFLLSVFIFLPFVLFAQITESFDDGNFTANPVWSGDVSFFEIVNPPVSGDGSLASSNDGQVLRSFPMAGDAVLLTSSTNSYGEWRFSIADGYNWAVSSTNDFKIILMTDNSTTADLLHGSQNFNGYYLKFDGATSDQFVLYRQSGTVSTPLIVTGYPTDVDGTSSIGRSIKVKRSAVGEWAVFIEDEFDVEATTQRGSTVIDNSHTTSQFFGIVTNITNPGAARLVYFDNLYIGPEIEDTVKPELSYLSVISDTQLDVHFSETVEQTTAETTTNYFVNNSIGNPVSATLDITDNSIVHLTFSTSFTLGLMNTMTIQNITDLNSNIINPVDEDFMYFIISPYDIVINEIMADPSPVIGLPEFEFIELHNTTPIEINLAGWMLTVGSTIKTLNTAAIPANGYIILCHPDAESLLSDFGTVLTVESFPALTNAGTTIKIEDNLGQFIDQVAYTLSWYGDGTKDDGGYTIERIDPENTCSGIGNWTASVNTAGGTPGIQNSVFASNTDNTVPFIIDLVVVNSIQLRVYFSEPVSVAEATTLSSYLVSDGFGNPYLINMYDSENKVYNMFFDSVFTSGSTYTLSVGGISDDCLNPLTHVDIEFQFYIPATHDLLICEIMADPDPVVGLPGAEYVEITNNSVYDISMVNWTFMANDYSDMIPDMRILPGEHIILCDVDDTAAFSSFGKTRGISGMSELTNSGMTLALVDETDRSIHRITYSDDWFAGSFKADGGWSLEMIDPDNPCTGEDNWKPSVSTTGGTPGVVNSVDADNPDVTPPEISHVGYYSTSIVEVFFNERIDPASINPDYYFVRGSDFVIDVIPVEPEYLSVLVYFIDYISYEQDYLDILDTITDCSGNQLITSESFGFAVPVDPAPFDIVINEVLFDPLGDGSDYIEIYNRSSNTFDLKDLRLATRDETGIIESVKEVSSESFLMAPGSYMVITEDIVNVQTQYYTPAPKLFVEAVSMPSYSNESGEVVLMDKTGEVLDDFIYNADMHYELLSSVDGVSIERIDFDVETNSEMNWHSAAQTVGFGTPAYKNSVYNDQVIGNELVNVSPEVFSPDNDGYEDILTISYKFGQAGYVANVKIFDAKGRLVIELVKGDLLGTEGTYTWDGIDRFDEKARIGAYILYFEVFDLKGNTNKYKLPVIVASKL